ncbi:MAG: MarR family transcriptional regulator [Verrucomicrobia bacterium]|nr:MarR family transcriptional regulator [Verrucomicrobiota bacterium]
MTKQEDTSGMHVWLVLWKAFKALETLDKRSISQLGLGGISDFAILEVLYHKGPTPINAIGKTIQLTSGSITAAVDRAEKRGLVERQWDPEDRRVIHAALTAEGKTTIRSALKKHATELEAVAKGLSKAERSQLLKLLKKLGYHAAALC